MNKRIGILQPGRIGDIIISLPIAKYYVDRGYEIVWPIAAPFIKQFTDVVDYVQFIPIKHDNIADTAEWHDTSEWILNQFDCDKKFDFLFNMTGTDKASSGWKKSGKPFDEYRYEVAEVPFDEKWKLNIKRNKQKEQELYNKVVTNNNYIVCHLQASSVRRTVSLSKEILENYQVLELTQQTGNVFDWCLTLEKATKLIMIDSCFANLVEQLNLNDNKVLLNKGKDFQLPTIRTKWRVM